MAIVRHYHNWGPFVNGDKALYTMYGNLFGLYSINEVNVAINCPSRSSTNIIVEADPHWHLSETRIVENDPYRYSSKTRDAINWLIESNDDNQNTISREEFDRELRNLLIEFGQVLLKERSEINCDLVG